MYNYLPHTHKVREKMLRDIELDSIEDLFKNINPKITDDNKKSVIPEGLSELEARKKLISLAKKNLSISDCISFLGGGIYNRYIPACVNTIVERSEFLTSYTPYQPEVSQGTLQVMYEYQSMICNITGMDVANASVYDGATACAEAILMASRLTKKTKALLSSTINPYYKRVIETYCYGADIELDYLPFKDGKTDINRIDKEFLESLNEYACILIQNPNYLGCIEDVFEISEICKKLKSKSLFIVCADPVSLGVLESPSKYGADIIVGDIQPLGISMAFGGPHGGFIACKSDYLRQLPGRIAGMTKDRDGERAFTLTLQAREQHIRRGKATSNICTNQALMALAATVYLSVTGPEGIKEIALISTQQAHYLADKINKISGFKILFSNFLYEFVMKIDNKIGSDKLIEELEARNILPGIRLDDKFESFKNHILVSVTEMNDINDLHSFLNGLKEISIKYKLAG
ncbi:MAG: aminomethyl-transferring glycine dehydrogenase subunit GcvPA [bacterium]